MDRHLLHILHGGCHQRLFLDVGESAQTAIAKPMELFSIREASLNRFFSFFGIAACHLGLNRTTGSTAGRPLSAEYKGRTLSSIKRRSRYTCLISATNNPVEPALQLTRIHSFVFFPIRSQHSRHHPFMSSYLYYTTLTRCYLKINKHKEGRRDFLDSLRLPRGSLSLIAIFRLWEPYITSFHPFRPCRPCLEQQPSQALACRR